METWILVHLHLQQHHRELRAASFGAAGAFPRPEHPIKAVAQFLDFKGLKTVELIAGGIWVVAQRVGAGAEPGRSERIKSGALWKTR